MELHIAVPVVTRRRQRHAEVGDLDIEQLGLLRNGVEMRRRHEVVIHCDHATTRDQIDHVHQQVIVHTEQNIRLIQRVDLPALAHRVHLDGAVGPDLLLTARLHTYRNLLLKELLHLLHVADLPDTQLLVALVRQVQHNRSRRHGELLSHAVMAVCGQTCGVCFIQAEVDGAFVGVLDGGGDSLNERRAENVPVHGNRSDRRAWSFCRGCQSRGNGGTEIAEWRDTRTYPSLFAPLKRGGRRARAG